MTLNPFKFKSPLDEVQFAVWNEVAKTRRDYKTGFHDCSNMAYLLWYYWNQLEMPCNIYTCLIGDQGHAQVEVLNMGYYDPAQNKKIEVAKMARNFPDAESAKRLPGDAKFYQYVSYEEMLARDEYCIDINIFAHVDNMLKKYKIPYIQPKLKGQLNI